jgi:ammonia channel protein AmtB
VVLAGVTMAFSFAATMAVLSVTDLMVGLRVSPEDEEAGLDATEHGESGYGWHEMLTPELTSESGEGGDAAGHHAKPLASG